MATLNLIHDLSNFPITRQDLYNMWSTAALSNVAAVDLTTGFQSILLASSYSDVTAAPDPGQLAWIADQQLMMCYHDEIDGTGVSLWLAIGPDVFETACILAEPAFPGALVEPFYDRWVKPSHHTDSILGDGVCHKMIGNVHSGVPYPLNTETPNTLASGTWVRVGIDGLLIGWVPNASGISETSYSISEGIGVGSAPDDASHTGGGSRGGMVRYTQSSGRFGVSAPELGFCGLSIYTSFNGGTASNWGQHFRYKFTGYQDQQDRTP